MRWPISPRSPAGGQSYLQVAMDFASLNFFQSQVSRRTSEPANSTTRTERPNDGVIRSGFHCLRGFQHRRSHAHVSTATAQIAAQAPFKVLTARVGMFSYVCGARYH